MIKESIAIFRVLTYIPIAWVVLFSSFIIRAKIVHKDLSIFTSMPPYMLGFGFHYTATYWASLLMLLTMVIGVILSLVLIVVSMIKKDGREEMKKNSNMKTFLIVYFLILLFIQFDPNKLFYWMFW